MFEKKFITEAINRSAENRLDRRRFLRAAGIGTLGVGAVSVLGAPEAFAQSSGPSDAAILNFALNLEYLEAQFYAIAATGTPLPDSILGGTGTKGAVSGGRAVKFSDPKIKAYAEEIAKDEKEHVVFLRTALGSAAVAQPAIDIDASFKAAAKAAGLGDNFDPYASDLNFLLGAFVFEDVGVTAYKGAAPLISNKTYLGAAAGILAAEAYHAALIRTTLYSMGVDAQGAAGKISAARDSLDGPGSDDQGIGNASASNIVPLDSNGLAFGRTPGQVLNIVYLNPGTVTKGGFFPNGVNGTLNSSGGGASTGGTATASGTGGAAGGSSSSGGTGTSATPTGGAGTGAGGTSGGRDTELLVGGALAAAGAVAAAGAYQHSKKTASDGVTQEHTD
jgi:hypothetical protein